ncbi:MAG TPA: CaiB/BaiF CoA-transferase family protein [Gammaproteobacteria bacterium]|nr:CaiB/BaiF CoA-transferase family protein [Gammaproteobacteria bacterium]
MAMKHILTGFKVLDFTHVLAGPAATRLMVEMGAEVIKVEFPPLGDMSRALPTIVDGRSAYYVQQNRGKKSLCVNLKTEEGKALIYDLIRQVDVVIENFAPGVAARLGIGWEKVHELNPRVVMCSISAFGQQGPLSSLPGFDYIAQAYAGVTGMIGEPDAAPSLPMLGLGDVTTGVHAAAAIGYALLHRERGGEGQYLDISLLDSYFHCHEINVALYGLTGRVPTRAGHHHYAVCPLGLFKHGERYVCIIALDPQWQSLCSAMGQPALGKDERYDSNAKRVERASEVIALVQAWVDKQTSVESIVELLAEYHVPCAPVMSIAEVCNMPHMIERGTVRRISDPKLGEFTVPGMPLRFSGFTHEASLEGAYLGHHNEEVLRAMLGLSSERIEALRTAGVLHANPGT